MSKTWYNILMENQVPSVTASGLNKFDALLQIREMFVGVTDTNVNISLYGDLIDEKGQVVKKDRCVLYLDNFHCGNHRKDRLMLKKGLSFLTMMLKVAEILGVSEGDVVVVDHPGGCPTCDYGSKTDYEVMFWNK